MAFTTREKYLLIRKMNLISTVGLTNIKAHSDLVGQGLDYCAFLVAVVVATIIEVFNEV